MNQFIGDSKQTAYVLTFESTTGRVIVCFSKQIVEDEMLALCGRNEIDEKSDDWLRV